jgi:hypothetical protein
MKWNCSEEGSPRNDSLLTHTRQSTRSKLLLNRPEFPFPYIVILFFSRIKVKSNNYQFTHFLLLVRKLICSDWFVKIVTLTEFETTNFKREYKNENKDFLRRSLEKAFIQKSKEKRKIIDKLNGFRARIKELKWNLKTNYRLLSALRFGCFRKVLWFV